MRFLCTVDRKCGVAFLADFDILTMTSTFCSQLHGSNSINGDDTDTRDSVNDLLPCLEGELSASRLLIQSF